MILGFKKGRFKLDNDDEWYFDKQRGKGRAYKCNNIKIECQGNFEKKD